MIRKAKGFTLIELMIGLVVLGIMVSMAAPAFTQMMAQQRLRAASNELRMSMALARSEAVKRNAAIVLLPASGGWSNGWCVETTGKSSCSSSPIGSYVAQSSVSVSSRKEGGSSELSNVSFNLWGRATDCPHFELSTAAGEATCKVCVYVMTDGRVEADAGACANKCPSAISSSAPWSGACDG